jgi:hypothetical protein
MGVKYWLHPAITTTILNPSAPTSIRDIDLWFHTCRWMPYVV